MAQKLYKPDAKAVEELEKFYQIGECYKALIDMTFSEKNSYLNRPENIAIETYYVKIPTGTIVTFLELFIKNGYINAIFLYDNKMLVGPPCTVSLSNFKHSFVKIT